MKDALHHQQQAIFRNTGSPTLTAWEFVHLGWCWRRLALNPLWRCLPLALVALLNVAIFGVAGIFSSEVTKAPGNETLIRGPRCGWWTLPSDGVGGSRTLIWTHKGLNDSLAAAAYARACYQGAGNILECSKYVAKELEWRA